MNTGRLLFRSTGNPNLAERNDHKLPGRQLVTALLQRLIQMFDLGLQLGPGKSEKQDAGVGKALVEDQLAEIAIGNDQNSLLLPGNRQDVLIREAWRVVARDGRHVMAEASKVGNEAKVSALIKQELHTSGASERAPFGGFGETSSPVTIAFA